MWYKNVEDVMLIRKPDLENHNRNGGHWVVFNKKVYDIQETRYLQVIFIILFILKLFLTIFRSSEMNYSFVTMLHSSTIYEHVLTEMPKETLQSCFVGNYLDPDEDIVEVNN